MAEQNPPLPPELKRLSTFIDTHIECLAGSSSELRSIALHAVKHIFDWALETEKSSKPHIGALLATLTEAAPPQTRSQARNATRQSPMEKPRKKVDIRETPLPSLFIEDMNADQIWQQLDLRAARVCENLQTLLGEDEDEGKSANWDGDGSDNDGSEIEDEDEGEDEDEDEEEDEDEDEEEEDEDEKMDIDEDETMWEELSDGDEDGSSIAEDVVNLRDETPEEEEADHEAPASMLHILRGRKLSSSGSFSQGHSDLDDGFFDLASFNAETSELETREVYQRKLNLVADEDSAEESEVDLFGAVDDSTAEGMGDGPELFYKDFFEPPPRVQHKDTRSSKVRFHDRVSVKKIKAVGKGMPVSSMDDEDSDDDEES